MARSTLERTGERPPRVDKGHTTRELGPGDRSDTGSDIVGGPGLEHDSDALGLGRGTTSDAEHMRATETETAGPDIGDENLDSDTDSGGTGERAAAGRDAPPATDETLSVVDEVTGESDLVPADDVVSDVSVEDVDSVEEREPEPTTTRERPTIRKQPKPKRKRRS